MIEFRTPNEKWKLKNPIIGQKHDIIFIIINKFTKWGYFVVYTEEISAEDIA